MRRSNGAALLAVALLASCAMAPSGRHERAPSTVQFQIAVATDVEFGGEIPVADRKTVRKILAGVAREFGLSDQTEDAPVQNRFAAFHTPSNHGFFLVARGVEDRIVVDIGEDLPASDHLRFQAARQALEDRLRRRYGERLAETTMRDRIPLTYK